MEHRIPREVIWVTLVVAAGLLFSLGHLALNETCTSPDSYEYLRGGVSLWSGQGFKGMSGRAQVTFPPFYPLLIGAANLALDNPLLAGRIVSLVASVVSILLLYLVARAFLPGTAAVGASLLYACLPLRISLSGMIWSESTFAALVLAGVLLWIGCLTRPILGLACGLALGLAYLTRPEGALVTAVLLLGAVLMRRNGEERTAHGLRRLALIILGFFVVSVPYVLYLRVNTGKWRLTTKAAFNSGIASRRTEGVPFEQLRLLSADATEVRTRPQAASIGTIAKRVVKNTRTEVLILTQAVSPPLLVAIGLGLATGWWRRRGRVALATFLALAVPALILPFLFIEERMLIMGTVVLVVLAAASLHRDERHAEDHPGFAPPVLATAFIVIALGWMLVSSPLRSAMRPRPGPGIAPMLAAVLEVKDAEGSIIGNGVECKALAFAAGRDYLALPWAPLPRALRYARLRGASFLLARTTDHPQIAAVAHHAVRTKDLIPIARVERSSDGDRVIMRLYLIRNGASSQE